MQIDTIKLHENHQCGRQLSVFLLSVDGLRNVYSMERVRHVTLPRAKCVNYAVTIDKSVLNRILANLDKCAWNGHDEDEFPKTVSKTCFSIVTRVRRLAPDTRISH